LATAVKPRNGATDPYTVEFYEGLCRKTASRYFPYVEESYEDIVQLLRIKSWQALKSFDPTKARQPVEGYVFQCLVNRCKDLLRKKKRNELYIEDLAPNVNIVMPGSSSGGQIDGAPRDSFEARYLARDQNLADVLDDAVSELGLGEVALGVAEMLRDGHPKAAAGRAFGLTETEMRSALDEIEAAVHRHWRWQWAAA
jgi:RNA polymerase sigma factor (sigma-70 family)